MGEVCDATPRSFDGRIEFDKAENDHKIFCTDREEKINVDLPIWK